MMDLSLKEIFEAVQVIEPLAFPVWQNFIGAYPDKYFNQIIKQVAEQLQQDQDDTYEKLIAMMHEGIHAGSSQIDKMLNDFRTMFKKQQRELERTKEEVDNERWRHARALDELERKLTVQHGQFLKEEVARINQNIANEIKQKDSLIELQNKDIDRLKRGKENFDLKIVLFKWRMAGKFIRFVEELLAKFLDKDSLKDLLYQDMQKLFFGNELHQLSNSLNLYKSLHKTAESTVKMTTSEGHELRCKVNILLTERTNYLNQLEKQKIVIWDAITQSETEKKKRLAIEKEMQECKEKQKAISDLLSRQVKLKEAFEDKLRNTLDIKAGFEMQQVTGAAMMPTMSDGLDEEEREQRRRQEETKRIIKGFDIERQSKLILHQDDINDKRKNVEDIHYNDKQVCQEIQTEIHSATIAKMDLVIQHAPPVRPEQSRVPKMDQSMQTDISSNIIDFLAGGSQKYEQVMELGLIRAVDIKDQQVNTMTQEEYLKALMDQESTDRVLFSKRKKFVGQDLKGMSSQSIKFHRSTTLARGKSSSSNMVRSTTSINDKPKARRLNSGVDQVAGFQRQDVGIAEDRISEEDSDKQGRQSKFAKGKKKTGKSPPNKQSPKNAKDTQSKLVLSKTNSRSVSDSELNASDTSSILTTSDDTDLAMRLNEDIRMSPKMTEAPDYKEKVEKKNVLAIFNSYVQLLDIMINLDGKLYRTAMRTLKKQPGFKLDFGQIKKYKRMYPELIPDVFWRLWQPDRDRDEKDHKQRRQLIFDAKQAWNQKLKDQGKLTELEASMLSEQYRLEQETATNLDASIPYLNPMNINISADSISPDRVQEFNTEEKPSKPTVLVQRSGKKSGRYSKEKVRKGAKCGSILTDVVDSVHIMESPTRYRIDSNGVFGMPKSQYEMKVTICPKTTIRQSIQLKKNDKFVNSDISPHFCFNPSRLEPQTTVNSSIQVKTSTLLGGNTRRIAKSLRASKSKTKPQSRNSPPTVNLQEDASPRTLRPPMLSNLNHAFHTIDNREKTVSSPLTFDPASDLYNGANGQVTVAEDVVQVVSRNSGSVAQVKKVIQQAKKLKRPSTCKVQTSVGRSTFKINKNPTMTNPLKQKTTNEQVTSQDFKSTLHDTQSIQSRPLRDVLSGTLNDMRNESRMVSLRQTDNTSVQSYHRRTVSKPCPVKAFNMHQIPINDQERVRKSYMEQQKKIMNSPGMTQALSGKKTKNNKRIHSATFSKTVMRQANQSSQQSTKKPIIPIEQLLPPRKTQRITFIPNLVDDPVNTSQPGMRASTQGLVTQSEQNEHSLQETSELIEEDDYNPLTSSRLELPKKKESLIKVNDQLDIRVSDSQLQTPQDHTTN